MIVDENHNITVSNSVSLLKSGKLVAIPTETVYGLAADATNENAIASIYKAKGRPSYNPLISHVCDVDMARQYVTVSDLAKTLMDHFWPGPLTFVLPKINDTNVAPSVFAGLNTLAVRCPANTTVQNIIKQLNRPIAAPSANPSGRISPTSAQDVANGLGDKVDMIIDGGRCSVGIESTIISVIDNSITLLRPGTVGVDEISDVADQEILDHQGDTITAPGQLSSHYAPSAPVTLNCKDNNITNCFKIGFGEIIGDINLSSSANLSEAATNLFHHLHLADRSGKQHISVAPVPNTGIGIAINDRLRRAAAPRHKQGNTE